jgi:uncharacterized membrane protein YgcG
MARHDAKECHEMIMRSVRVAAGSLVLTCSACVVAPPMPPSPAAVMQNCRQFTQTITVAGTSVPGYGVECLQADGTWNVAVPAQQTPPSAASVLPAPGNVYAPPYYAYPPSYAYPGVYPWVYPWYYGPDVSVGFGWGWGGGWHGGGWHGDGWGSRWHGGGWGGGGRGGGGRGGGGHGGGGRGHR